MCWPYGIISQVDLQMNCTVQKFPTHWIEFYLNVSVIFAENFSASWWLYSSCSYFPPRTCCNSLKFTVRTIIRGRRVCCSLGKRTRLRGACVCDWMSVCSRGPGRLLGDVHRPHAVLGSPLFTFFEEFEQNANWSISNLKLWNFLNGKQSKFRVFGWIIKCWQPLWRWLSILFLKKKIPCFFFPEKCVRRWTRWSETGNCFFFFVCRNFTTGPCINSEAFLGNLKRNGHKINKYFFKK